MSNLHIHPSVCVLGSGPAGLVTAHTLLRDGFENVTVLTRDTSPGGTWAIERLYPGVMLNRYVLLYLAPFTVLTVWSTSVHGEFRFSALPMPPAKHPESGRLSGEDLWAYMQSYADRFLKGRIRFNTEVERIRRERNGGWHITARDTRTMELIEDLQFDKLVLCTGVRFSLFSALA